MFSWRQVTIVTNNVPAVGAESGETHFQGDMEKADMVDGTKLLGLLFFRLHRSLQPPQQVLCWRLQASKRACAGRPLQRSTPTRPASTRRSAPASRTCSLYQVWLHLFDFSPLFPSKLSPPTCKNDAFPFPFNLKMATSTKMQSTTCATVSPATSCGETRRTTSEESHPETTPCRLDGAASPSGGRLQKSL